MERALSAVGVTIETATTDDGGPGRRVNKPRGQGIAENGVTRWYFAKQTEFYKVSWPLKRWLQANIARFDLVHIHALFSFSSTVAAQIARRAEVPYVIRPLGVLNRYGMTQRRAMLKKLSFRWLESGLLRDAAAVQFTSVQEQQEAECLGVTLRSVIIPLGLEPVLAGDAQRFLQRYPELQDKQRLLFLSRLDPKKNLEGLLRAMCCLIDEYPNLALIICGDGKPDYIAQLKQWAQDLSVADRMYWLGQVEGEDKADVLAAGHVFVLPSYSENFGIAAVEALAAGLPCVLGKGVAIADSVVQAGAGVAVDPQPESIAQGIRLLLSDPTRQQKAALQARQLAQNEYSAWSMGQRLAELYQTLLASDSRNSCSSMTLPRSS